MLVLGLRYLNGWSMATDIADRTRPEWPPHPDRVFMAMVAAHMETGADDAERQALLWLENLPPPHLACAESFATRASVVSYVPVNDTKAPRVRSDKTPSDKQVKAGLELLPAHRSRQARTFPVAVPADDTVFLVWPEAPTMPAHARALDQLCRKVTRVGHSSSLVQMWRADDAPEAKIVPNIVPDARMGAHRMRIPGPGRLDYLLRCYDMGQHPAAGLWSGYRNAERAAHDEVHTGVLDSDILPLRLLPGDERRSLSLTTTLAAVRGLRGLLMKHCRDPLPEWLSGHRRDRTPTSEPHIAFAPLAHVGHEHAYGHLLGLALIVPRAVPHDARAEVLGPALYGRDDDDDDDKGKPTTRTLRLGHAGAWKLQLEDSLDPPQAMRARTWTGGRRGAMSWATVTPFVFDRFPKSEADKERDIVRACERMGLPEPSDIVTTKAPLFVGVPPAAQFPAMRTRKDGPTRYHQHIVIRFPVPVRGPVLLGAGRYRGYGLCRPYPTAAEAAQ
ncbi:type I-G CRISPR-associated protein Csb2 [Haliangium ochraceum]|uniref:CRISPR-associated protein, GSU0054 n=1 Tax=Haliangium ochraceum (strain DSM 14365 / JCM 11303 / SMP-2) TaxID=502025 RepID=D0LSW6_HALO1|nr:type I-U CRISPR-associated protein Csb2 [Haliangium ochraceum]ACY17338.1 conserved hypothetical protein [Haliangium ochraceum DSM 14365]